MIGDDLVYEVCPDCLGEGEKETEHWEECVGDYAVMVVCPTCNGERKILREYEPEKDDE